MSPRDPRTDRPGTPLGFEPLGLVQVHHADNVAERPGSSGSDSTSLVASRSASSASAASARLPPVLDHLAHAVDGMEQVAGIDAAGCRRGQRQVAGVLEHAFERSRRQGARASSDSTGAATPSAVATGAALVLALAPVASLTEHAEPAAGLLERKQLAVADAEQRAAQHPDQRQLSCGSASARNSSASASTSRDSPNAPAPLTSIGMFNASSACTYGSRAPLPGEDQKVAVGAAAGVDLGPDEPRDVFCFGSRNLAALDILSDRQCVHAGYCSTPARYLPWIGFVPNRAYALTWRGLQRRVTVANTALPLRGTVP